MNNLQFIAGFLTLILVSNPAFSQSLQQADSLNRVGMKYYESGSYEEAERDLGDAYRMYRKIAGPETWLRPGIDYAEILVDRFKYKRALTLFNLLKKTALAQEDIRARARIENDLGWLSEKTGDYTRALEYYKTAIPLAEKARDTLRLGYIYNNIGSIYISKGDYETAISYRKKSLVYKEQAGNLKSISITLNNLAVSYRQLNLYDKALDFYKQSLAIKKKLGNTELLASSYNNIAMLYKDIGQYAQALHYYQQSLVHYKETGDPKNSAHVYNNIGTLYGVLGQPEQELAYYRQALELKEQYANPASISVSYANIAASYRESRQLEKALNYYEQALALRRQAGNPRRVAASLLDLARFNMDQEQYGQAERSIAEAKIIADSTKDSSLQREAAMLKGQLYLNQDNPADASMLYKEALSFSKSLSKHSRIIPLLRMAYAYHKLKSDSALYYGEQAIKLIEGQRTQVGSVSELKANYFKDYVSFYVDMASWFLTYNQDVSEAYRLVELVKARALTDDLARAAQRIDESLPEEKRLERARRLAAISQLHKKLDQATESEEQQLRKELRDKELAYNSFENTLQANYANYKNFEIPQSLNLSQVQRMCDAETAVLEFTVSNRMILGFLITQNDVQVHQISADTSGTLKKLQSQVFNFRESILAKAPVDSLDKRSLPIYETLIKPFQKSISNYENLLIISDGFLTYLPFEALKANGNYLVSQHNIKYAPSMTGLSLIQKHDARSREEILAIGNASAQGTDSGGGPLLPSVEYEIDTITSLFKNAISLKEEEISESKVKEELQRGYPLIHIAAHSEIDEQNSFLSGIILGEENDELGIGNDGRLRSSEIYRLNISSELVVLSACKSGIGDVISGEGILGLQRAFFNSGASTVVVSLWDVYDRSTTKFMKEFYTHLKSEKEGQSWSGTWKSFLRWTGWDESIPFGYSSSAMRKAKLAMLENPKYSHPVYWAPFIVVGR